MPPALRVYLTHELGLSPHAVLREAVPLLLLTILLLQAQKFILGRRGFSVVGGKYGAPRKVVALGVDVTAATAARCLSMGICMAATACRWRAMEASMA